MRRTFLILSLVLSLSATDRAEDLAIVVGRNVPITNLTQADLTQIFRCEKTQAGNNLKFLIVTREKGSAERACALRCIYKLSDAAYEKYFLSAVFTGTLPAAPRLIPSGSAMKKIAVAAPGTLAYIRASEIDDTVQIVKVDGLAPGEPNYPLKF